MAKDTKDTTKWNRSKWRQSDKTLGWLQEKYPQLADWREFAVKWIKNQSVNSPGKLSALSTFFERYLIGNNLPLKPAEFLARRLALPDGKDLPNFHETACPKGKQAGIHVNNNVHDFLEFVLSQDDFSVPAGGGKRVTSPVFRNPVPPISYGKEARARGEKRKPKSDRNLRNSTNKERYMGKKPKNVSKWRQEDKTLGWLKDKYPHLAEWREFAMKWIKDQSVNPRGKLTALSLFFERYFVGQGLSLKPAQFLARSFSSPDGKDLPGFYETTLQKGRTGISMNNYVHDFLEFVLSQEDFTALAEDGQLVTSTLFRNPVPPMSYGASARPRGERPNLKSDRNLGWVQENHPQLTDWREFAVKWIKEQSGALQAKLDALSRFFERYLVGQGLPSKPAELLARRFILPDGKDLPDFYKTACPDTEHGIGRNNYIHDFLNFVLSQDEFIELADDGQRVTSTVFRNPVRYVAATNLPKRAESVYSPLPYIYIDELRKMLAEGPSFRDWKWAQTSLGVEIGGKGSQGTDWFDVIEHQIDRNDPDCVWRTRTMKLTGEERLEMWSPVRWVGLLVKLILPLRTFQVRVLDSGEADYLVFSYKEMKFVENSNSDLRKGTERRPLQQGIFRRPPMASTGEPSVPVVLYANTNKTADIAKSGSEKGYCFPWVYAGASLHEDVIYWLEKLRNWQQKYNPISRRTAWTELDSRHGPLKSDLQLAGYPDACFLFRLAEEQSTPHLPLRRQMLERCWFNLLEAFEQRIADRGQTHSHGEPIRFLPEEKNRRNGLTTLFPLHSLRVSLITALALDGKMPLEVMYRIVGHSRLIMTLYYIKPGMSYMLDVLSDAAKRMEAQKEQSLLRFLQNTEFEQLLKDAICNDRSSLAAVIPRHPATRNAAGWMPLHIGMCLAGGNNSEISANQAIRGCYNGGPILVNLGPKTKYGPVPGGIQNCVRCRWFVTEPKHLVALTGHCDNLSWHCDEARKAARDREDELNLLKKQRADREDAGQPFTELAALARAERQFEKAVKKLSDLVQDVSICRGFIDRCIAAHNQGRDGMQQLVPFGDGGELKAALESTDSELLQISGVCQNAEIFPEEDTGNAVYRQAEYLDATLIREKKPPVFLLMNEKEKLVATNAYLRNLAAQMNPENPWLGKRDVIALIDAKKSLSEHFGMDITSLLPESAKSVLSSGAPQPADVVEISNSSQQLLLVGGAR